MFWLDHFSPRAKLRRASKSTSSPNRNNKREKTSGAGFTPTHTPDRPTRRIAYENIPSEEECRAIFESLVRDNEESSFRNGALAMAPTVDAHDGSSTREISTARPVLSISIPENRETLRCRGYSGKPPTAKGHALQSASREYSAVCRCPSTPQSRGLTAGPTSTTEWAPVQGRLTRKPALRFPPPRRAPVQGADSRRTSAAAPRGAPAEKRRRCPKGQASMGLTSHPVTEAHGTSRANACRLCRAVSDAAGGLCQSCEDEYSVVKQLFSPCTKRESLLWRPLPPLPLEAVGATERDLDDTSFYPLVGMASRFCPLTARISQASTVVASSSDFATGWVVFKPPPAASRSSEQASKAETHEEDVYSGEWARYYFDEDNFGQRAPLPRGSGRTPSGLRGRWDLAREYRRFPNLGPAQTYPEWV